MLPIKNPIAPHVFALLLVFLLLIYSTYAMKRGVQFQTVKGLSATPSATYMNIVRSKIITVKELNTFSMKLNACLSGKPERSVGLSDEGTC